jgi:hypothetical protein
VMLHQRRVDDLRGMAEIRHPELRKAPHRH